MRNLSFLLLCAFALTNVQGVYHKRCPRNWNTVKLIPHRNCNQFYHCWLGRRVLNTCPQNLFFSIEEKRCTFWNLVDCGDRHIPIDATTSTTTAKPEINEGNNDPSEAPSICARAGSDGVLIAHERCTKYYICVNGRPVTQRCPARLFFNPRIDQCDWQSEVDCGNRISTGLDDNEDELYSEYDNLGANNSNPSEAPIICARLGSDGELVAHEKCSRYYICVHGKPLAQDCPANLHFNPEKDECDWPRNVACTDKVSSASEERSSESTEGEESSEEDSPVNNINKDKILKLLRRLKQATKILIRRLLEKRDLI